MSNKRVTDFFKPKVSKSNKGVSTNLPNASAKQGNDPHLNEKQNKESSKKWNFSIHQNMFFRKKEQGF